MASSATKNTIVEEEEKDEVRIKPYVNEYSDELQQQHHVLNLPKVNFNFLDDSMVVEEQSLAEAVATQKHKKPEPEAGSEYVGVTKEQTQATASGSRETANDNFSPPERIPMTPTLAESQSQSEVASSATPSMGMFSSPPDASSKKQLPDILKAYNDDNIEARDSTQDSLTWYIYVMSGYCDSPLANVERLPI